MGPTHSLRVSVPEGLLELKESLSPHLEGTTLNVTFHIHTLKAPHFDLHILLDPDSDFDLPIPERVLILLSQWTDALAMHWLSRGVMNCLPSDDSKAIARGLMQASRLSPILAEGRLFPQIINAIPMPIFLKDTLGRFLGSNNAFTQYIGLSPEALAGKTYFDINDLELAQVYHEADTALIERGGTQAYEAQVQFANGSLHDVDIHKAVFECPLGTKAGLVGVMTDITVHKRLEETLKAQALSDPLTGAHNRRSFMSLASSALEQSRRSGRSLSLLVMDLDHFKTINDKFSHAAGDKILVDVVTRCQECLRSYDVLCRAGGEEFFVLLPDTDTNQAITIAERIRLTISALSIGQGGSLFRVTTSIGVAEFSPSDPDIDALLHRADTALYSAKNAGRNRVEVARSQAIDAQNSIVEYQRREDDQPGGS